MTIKSISIRAVASLAASFLLASSISAADASVSYSGNLTNILGVREGKLFFSHGGTRTTRPSCATEDRWVIDVSTPGGQTLASMLLTASSQNKVVGVAGTGACTDWGDTESVSNIIIYT